MRMTRYVSQFRTLCRVLPLMSTCSLAAASQAIYTDLSDSIVSAFRQELQRRDGECIFTRYTGEARHIIPFARGTEWLQAIVQTRSMTPSLQDINDKQNGFMCQGDLHRLLDKKQLAVLYTPNPILDCGDVPSRADVPKPRGREYPSFCCYTLQNLNILNEPDVCFWQDRLHNNVSKSLDGWFRVLDRHKLPHPGLLHYVYGLSVLEAFGSASAWQNANAPWFRPKGQSQAFRQSHISQTMTDHETTHDKRFAQASPMQGSHPPAPKADEQGFVRITAEEAEDFVCSDFQ